MLVQLKECTIFDYILSLLPLIKAAECPLAESLRRSSTFHVNLNDENETKV